jgi:hypothetical protein
MNDHASRPQSDSRAAAPKAWAAVIDILSAWGEAMRRHPQRETAVLRACAANPGFTEGFVQHAVDAIARDMLRASVLEPWLRPYEAPVEEVRTIALVPAANVPAVGFHDLLCILTAGHRAQIRLSDRDAALLPWMVDCLAEAAPDWSERVAFVERLQGFDAVLATGSNNAGRYFDHYFGRYPHIIRRNRQSLAVLDGHETAEELAALGQDLFLYFGLGCRSVNKLLIPEDQAVEPLLEAWPEWRETLLDHSAYRHNYDYQRTLLLLNNTQHWANDYYMVVESEAMAAPLATIHLERYRNGADLQQRLERDAPQTQIVVGRGPGRVAFGEAQKPGPEAYADGQDTMAFLLKLDQPSS